MNNDDLTTGELFKLSANSIRTAVKLFFLALHRCRYQILWGVLTFSAVVLSLASLGGFVDLQTTPVRFLKRIAWATELSSNFHLFYLLLLGIFAALFFWGRKLKRGLIVAIFAGLNLILLLPFYAPQPPPAAGQTFRTLMINAGFSVSSEADAVDLIRASQPDIIALVEARPELQASLDALRDTYAFSTYQAGTDYYDGVLLYSKYPFTVQEGAQEGSKNTPSLVAQVDLAGHDLTLIATQTRAPLRPGRTVDRREQLQQLGRYVAGRPEAIMLIGDLNATAWSPIIRDFMRTSDLQDGRSGFGLQTSWPTFMPLLAIPIDHILVSPAINIHNFSKGPDIGSDHYPMLIDFSFTTAGESLSQNPPNASAPSAPCTSLIVDC